MEDELPEALFAQQKMRTERMLKKVVAVLAAALLLVLYFLLYG